MHSHALQVTRKVTEVLDRHEVPYTINDSGKHPHIEYKHNNQTHRVPLHNKRISGGFYDIIPTVRRVERTITRQEDEMSATATIVQIHSPTMTIESIRDFDGEPRVDEVTLGGVLGYTRTKGGMRAIVQRRRDEIESFGPIVSEAVPTTERGGRPGQRLFFNEAQSLLLTMFSDAPAAATVRRRLIEIFLEWKNGHAEPQAPCLPAPVESEILANGTAIEAITQAVVQAMGNRELVRFDTSAGDRPVMAADARKMLEDLFYWQRGKLNDMHNELARRDETLLLMSRALQDQEHRIHALGDQIETARRTIIGVVASTRTQKPVEPPRQAEMELPVPAERPTVEVAPPEPQIERVTIQQVYDIIGIDRRKVKIDRAFSGLVRMGLEHYHYREGVEIEKAPLKYGSGRVNMFARHLVLPWYEERGRANLMKHLKKRFRTGPLAGLA
ncbi:hypothetical protein [Methylobacterium indicum]|uniref:Antirepressor protein C-terminal domain-containing protein n=1 Tax=Methylobacterium indicum TaxID=1775910 RepID=A0A8H8X0I4_9HYPH|nr:hypothetical protein [Methylobacterium indicum]BCM87855.1 hypothetical protein mvi_63160 [Methylobacterium indicum]